MQQRGEILNIVGHASDVSLHIVAGRPIIATLRCRIADQLHELVLVSPHPLDHLTLIFSEFYGFIIVDKNIEGPNYLEFGRYRVELQTYDGSMADVIADRYTHSP